MSVLTVSETAARLGVTPRRVQQLVTLGQLRKVARGVIDVSSVERFEAVRGGVHTQAWALHTAWGAVALLSGLDAKWLGATQRSRLKWRLREIDTTGLVERTRGRAEVTRYRGHASARDRLASEIVVQPTPASLGLVGSSGVDGYVALEGVQNLVVQHGLIRDDDGLVTLRATAFDLGIIRDIHDAGWVLTALDLAESLDVRERRTGTDFLTQTVERFRG
ncbi:hypothetical protein AADG42_14230 [Ammonicoccus fulvus]|uniref:Helix-turn-helix domain-containing protein n=1 Tax=Ammonicoccus fulvus TaxID=3138240 RepID=A0ABZ3FUM9_9ACTN